MHIVWDWSRCKADFFFNILDAKLKQHFTHFGVCSNILNAKQDFVKNVGCEARLKHRYFGCKTFLLFGHFAIGCKPIFWFKHLGCKKFAFFKHFELEDKLVSIRSHTFVQTQSICEVFLSGICYRGDFSHFVLVMLHHKVGFPRPAGRCG